MFLEWDGCFWVLFHIWHVINKFDARNAHDSCLTTWYNGIYYIMNFIVPIATWPCNVIYICYTLFFILILMYPYTIHFDIMIWSTMFICLFNCTLNVSLKLYCFVIKILQRNISFNRNWSSINKNCLHLYPAFRQIFDRNILP